MDFIKKVEGYIRENSMLEQGMCLAAGVSGGADSMCLLHVLDQLRSRYALTLIVIHVHHGIRGAEADADEAFVRRECRRRGLIFCAVRKNVPELARQEGISEEEAGRNVRYQAFREIAQEYGCNKIAVAHNQNDNAETFLFHAFRGSGIRGLRGIMPCRDEIIRPLLCASRKEIEAYLAEEGICYRTDSTNLTLNYTRNRIRHEILKTAEEINSGASAHLSELAGELGRIADFLEDMARAAYGQVRSEQEKDCGCKTPVRSIRLSADGLMKLPPVLLGEVLKMALQEAAGSSRDIGRVHIESLKELAAGAAGRKLSLPYGVQAVRSYGILELSCGEEISEAQPFYQVISNFPADYGTEELCIRMEVIENEKKSPIPKNCYTKWFDYDKIRDILVLRTRQPGDYMVIHKDGRKKSLKSLLIDKKIPVKERETLLLLAAGSRILWIPGVRSEEGLYVDENTKRILVAELKRKGQDKCNGRKD